MLTGDRPPPTILTWNRRPRQYSRGTAAPGNAHVGQAAVGNAHVGQAVGNAHVGQAALGRPAERSSARNIQRKASEPAHGLASWMSLQQCTRQACDKVIFASSSGGTWP